MEIHPRPSSTGFLRKSAEERNKLEKKIREKERGKEKKESGEEKARLLWSTARCLCGLYISAFKEVSQAEKGYRDTHTQTKRPSALFKPQAHFFITSMRIWKQYDSQPDAISISQFLMMQHRCTQQLHKPDANTHSLSPRPRRLAPSHAAWTDRACGSGFLSFSSLVLVGFMWAVPIVNLTRPKVTPLLSEAHFFFTSFIVSLNNVYQSCVVCFERSAARRTKADVFLL